jgi:hypothetical protein
VLEAGGRVTDPQGGDAFLSSGDVVATNGLVHAELLATLGRERVRSEPRATCREPDLDRPV